MASSPLHLADFAHKELSTAKRALAKGAGTTALRALISAWRAVRCSALAELIEELSARVAEHRERPSGRSQLQLFHSWIRLARRRDPADLHVLCEGFEQFLARGHELKIDRALDELVELRDDPRLGLRAQRWREGYGWGGSRRVAIRDKFRTLLVAAGDPRTCEQGRPWSQDPQLRARLDSLDMTRSASLDAAIAELAPLVASAKLDPAADHSRSRAQPMTRAQLLEQVYEDPGNDEARLVLGDWLQAKGDPRGELISLQYQRREREPSRAARRRERALLDAHGERWLGPLARLLRPSSLVFERGFVCAAWVKPINVTLVEPERHHREWATLERLVVELRARSPATIISPHMRALRELEGVCTRGLLTLATECAGLPIEYLGHVPSRGGYRSRHRSHEGLDALRDCRGLDQLRNLYIRGIHRLEGLDWLWSSKVGQQLHTIQLSSHRESLEPSPAVPGHVRRVVWRGNAGWWMLERDGDQRFTRLHAQVCERAGPVRPSRMLGELARGELSSIEIELRTPRKSAFERRSAELRLELERLSDAPIELRWPRARPAYLVAS